MLAQESTSRNELMMQTLWDRVDMLDQDVARPRACDVFPHRLHSVLVG